MTLTPRQIELVRTTFAILKPMSRVAALAFYQRLFELDPALRGLFHTDIETQADKLMTMLQTATELVTEPGVLGPILLSLGQRHVDYGVRPEHYASVGNALLWSLGTTLGKQYTPEAHEAWAALYTLMSETMLQGARRSSDVATRPPEH